MLPRYPFIRLSKNLGDHLPPHPVFHTFFRFYNLSAETFFRESSSHPIFHTFFAFGRKKYQTFLQKNGRHSLSFDNRIKKYLSRNLFSDKEKAEKENRIGRFPSAHLGNDSRRNGETGILFVVLFLFFYIFFLLYSSHWGFMVNPPIDHQMGRVIPWLCGALKNPSVQSEANCFSRFCDTAALP